MDLTKEVVLEMLYLQNQLEVVISGMDWMAQAHDYPLAIHMECAEIIDHTPWKWWKGGVEQNDEAIRLELIDIWHFFLAYVLCETEPEGLPDAAEKIAGMWNAAESLEFSIADIAVSLGYGMLMDKQFNMYYFCGMCEQVNMSAADLRWLYVSKNVLNRFRQAYGYADGTYIKDWNGREDNDVLVELVRDAGGLSDGQQGITAEELYGLLESYYETKVLGQVD